MVNPKPIASLIGSILLGGQTFGAIIANTSDFEGNNKDGWLHPITAGNPNQTTIQMDGPFNNILSVTSSGGSGPGSRLVVPNMTAPWIGNYTAAGITAVQMDLVNNSGSTLSMRVAIEGGASGNRWASTIPVVLTPSQRGTFSFGLDSTSLVAAGGNDLTTALSDVTQLRILHNPTSGSYLGARVPGSFTVDNISFIAIPEPSGASMCLIGCTMLILRRNNKHTMP